jgi:hypothetical protein
MLPFIGPEMVAALLHRCEDAEEIEVTVQPRQQTRSGNMPAVSLRVRCKGMVMILSRRVRVVWRFGRPDIPPAL